MECSPSTLTNVKSQLHPELLEHIFQFAFDACEDAHESLSLLRAISQLDHLWAEYATSIRALHCLTVSTHDDLRQHARLCNRQPRASRMLRVLIVQLDLTDSSGQVSAANLRSFLPRAPNIQHLCFRYKPLPAAADGGGAVKGPAIDQDTVDMRNIFSRHNWYGFWMQLEQSLRLLQGLVSIERIHPCLMPTSESGDHVCGNTVKEKVHLLDTYAVPSYDKADEYLTRCDHGHSQRVTWFELTELFAWTVPMHPVERQPRMRRQSFYLSPWL